MRLTSNIEETPVALQDARCPLGVPRTSSSHEKHPRRMSACKKRVYQMIVVKGAVSRSRIVF